MDKNSACTIFIHKYTQYTQVLEYYLHTDMGVYMYCVTAYIHMHYWVCVQSYDIDVMLHTKETSACVTLYYVWGSVVA